MFKGSTGEQLGSGVTMFIEEKKLYVSLISVLILYEKRSGIKQLAFLSVGQSVKLQNPRSRAQILPVGLRLLWYNLLRARKCLIP